MDNENKKWVVVLVGPPGAGKGTQAELLAEEFGLYNFETSKIIEEKFADAEPNDEILKKEKEKFKSGQLNNPELVRKWVLDKVQVLSSEGQGIVFSGSPRTLFEAEGEIPVLEELYGKENVKVINLEIHELGSIERNSTRRLCEKNRHPIPNFPEFKDITECPKDGSKIVTRSLDTPETIKVRYQVYLKETKPVLEFLEKRGYNIIEIEGDQPIDKVFQDILEKIND